MRLAPAPDARLDVGLQAWPLGQRLGGTIMITYNANVVVHIDEELDEQQILDMERKLAFDNGVESSCVAARARHLMIIDYDPRLTSSSALLKNIHDRGLHAELVGGI
jgi:hypothetical protein